MPDTVIDAGIGGYLRWRPRMVRMSIFNDIRATLLATGWMDANLEFPFTVREFFAEFGSYVQDAVHVNTLVVDNGNPGEMGEWELGGELTRQYRFNLAFYAQDDDIGLAVFGDLSDRFDGLTAAPYVALYDYSQSTPPLVRMMEVDSWQWARAPQDAAPYEHHLFMAELIVRDFVSGDRTEMSA